MKKNKAQTNMHKKCTLVITKICNFVQEEKQQAILLLVSMLSATSEGEEEDTSNGWEL